MRKILFIVLFLMMVFVSGCEFLGSNDRDPSGNDDPIGEVPNGDQPGDTDPSDEDPGDTDPGDDVPGDTDPSDEEPGETDPVDEEPGDSNPGTDEPALLLTVSFESNGGSTIESVLIERDTALDREYVPSRFGYLFEGWFLDFDLTVPFFAEMVITESMTLYASWSIDLSGTIPIEAIYSLEANTRVTIEGVITAIDFFSFIVMDDTGYARVYGYYEDVLDVGYRVKVQGRLDDDAYILMLFLDDHLAEPFEVLDVNVAFHHEPIEMTIEDLANLSLDDALPVGYYRIVGLLAEEPIGVSRFMVEMSEHFIFIDTSWEGYTTFENNVGNVVDINLYLTGFKMIDSYSETGRYTFHYFTSEAFVSHVPTDEEVITILSDYLQRYFNDYLLRSEVEKPLPLDPYHFDVDVVYTLRAVDETNASLSLVEGVPYAQITNQDLTALTLTITLSKNQTQQVIEIDVGVEPIVVTPLETILATKSSLDMHYIHAIMLGHIYGQHGLIMDKNSGEIMIIAAPQFGGLPPQFSEFYAYGSYRFDGLNDIFFVSHIEGVVQESETLQHSLTPEFINPFSLYDEEIYQPFLYVHVDGYYDTGPITEGYPGLFSLNKDYVINVVASWDQLFSFYEYPANTRMVVSGFLITRLNNAGDPMVYLVFESFVNVFDD